LEGEAGGRNANSSDFPCDEERAFGEFSGMVREEMRETVTGRAKKALGIGKRVGCLVIDARKDSP
jgi:hypothetical protein